MKIAPFNLSQRFVVISPDKTATTELVNASMYQRLDKEYQNFKGHELVAIHNFSEDWNSWEMHPNGDELVVLLSGAITFTFELEHGEASANLEQAGSCLIVPKGIWHTALVKESAHVLFITPGEKTQHRNN